MEFKPKQILTQDDVAYLAYRQAPKPKQPGLIWLDALIERDGWRAVCAKANAESVLFGWPRGRISDAPPPIPTPLVFALPTPGSGLCLEGVDVYEADDDEDDIMVVPRETYHHVLGRECDWAAVAVPPEELPPELIPPGCQGRPSVMHIVLAEHARRSAAGECSTKSRSDEAAQLLAWLIESYPIIDAPTAGTIRNNLPPSYQPTCTK
jgi:hypothetical protein